MHDDLTIFSILCDIRFERRAATFGPCSPQFGLRIFNVAIKVFDELTHFIPFGLLCLVLRAFDGDFTGVRINMDIVWVRKGLPALNSELFAAIEFPFPFEFILDCCFERLVGLRFAIALSFEEQLS